MGVKEVSARWLKASRALKKEDQVYGQKLAEMAKEHSSEAFYALDDPLEAAVFSVLVEMLKERETRAIRSIKKFLGMQVIHTYIIQHSKLAQIHFGQSLHSHIV